MDKKTEAFLVELKNICPKCEIEYILEKSLHKFRFKREYHPHCWLYIESEFFSDNSLQELIMALTNQEKFETFINSPQNTWLFLTKGGINKVDENFCKNY